MTFRRFFFNWLQRTTTSGLWMCTTALLTAQSISHIPLPKDGQVVKIQSFSPSNEPRYNNLNIFWLNGVVSHSEEQMISEELAARISYPLKLISNGSLCQSHLDCYKKVDYIKAFFNRFGNQLTGRGNESIIEATKNVLREHLSSDLPKIQLVTYSEGGLIAHAAISDLNLEGNSYLPKVTVILMGTPLHHNKIAELKAIVGKVRVLNNSRDPVICLQNDVFDWSSWFGTNSKVMQCIAHGDLKQHRMKLYMEQLLQN